MATAAFQYPFGIPSVSGATITVDMMLNEPTRVSRYVSDIALQTFFANRIFATPGGVTGGAVVYDMLTSNDLYPTRDVQNVEPGAEFPIVTMDRPTPLVAQVEKFGGKFFVTDEARDRNQDTQLRNGARKVANAIVRGTNARAIAVLDAVVTSQSRTLAAANTWTVSTTTAAGTITKAQEPAAVFAAVRGQADAEEMGVSYDLLVLNPAQVTKFITYYGATNWEAILAANNLDVISSNRVTAGTGYFVEEGQVGEMRFEKPLSTETWREYSTQRTWSQTDIRPVMYATNPFSVLKVTGL